MPPPHTEQTMTTTIGSYEIVIQADGAFFLAIPPQALSLPDAPASVTAQITPAGALRLIYLDGELLLPDFPNRYRQAIQDAGQVLVGEIAGQGIVRGYHARWIG